jgi:hypothetical protein
VVTVAVEVQVEIVAVVSNGMRIVVGGCDQVSLVYVSEKNEGHVLEWPESGSR